MKVKLAPQSKPFTDVVGLEVGAGHAEGVPAVRLRIREGKLELLAAGFLKLPGQLPESPAEAMAEVPAWRLPIPFQATHAALTITSADTYLRHAAGSGEAQPNSKPFPYRTTSRNLEPGLPPIEAGIPEFQAAWAARLLPEGHTPTACSLQVSAAAAVNGFISSPLFSTLSGTAIVLFVCAGQTSLVAFHDGKIILYREHPVGYSHVRTAITSQMRIDSALADSVLQDTFIDPVPMIEPVLKTLFRQVEISADYLLRRRNLQVQQFFVCGLPAGANYWSSIFTRMMNLPLTLFRPFEYLDKTQRGTHLPEDLDAVEPFLMTALGAALAVLEDV